MNALRRCKYEEKSWMMEEKEKKAKLGIFKKRKFSYFLISSVKPIVLKSYFCYDAAEELCKNKCVTNILENID